MKGSDFCAAGKMGSSMRPVREALEARRHVSHAAHLLARNPESALFALYLWQVGCQRPSRCARRWCGEYADWSAFLSRQRILDGDHLLVR